MQPRGSVLFLVFIVTLGLGVAGALLPELIVSTTGASFISTDAPVEAKELTPCRNEDGVTLVRGDVIRAGGGRLKAYFALSNEGPLPIYFFSDTNRELTDLAEYGGKIHEIKPYELEWVLLPIPEGDQPFKATINYRQGSFRSARWLTASFTRSNKFPDACQ